MYRVLEDNRVVDEKDLHIDLPSFLIYTSNHLYLATQVAKVQPEINEMRRCSVVS